MKIKLQDYLLIKKQTFNALITDYNIPKGFHKKDVIPSEKLALQAWKAENTYTEEQVREGFKKYFGDDDINYPNEQEIDYFIQSLKQPKQ